MKQDEVNAKYLTLLGLLSLPRSIIARRIFVVFGTIFCKLDESALLEERERRFLKLKTGSASSVNECLKILVLLSLLDTCTNCTWHAYINS